MRWLRTAVRQARQSMSGVMPVSRVQPRVTGLAAVSQLVALSRSAAVRRLREVRQAAEG
jgi:hypothetical protein